TSSPIRAAPLLIRRQLRACSAAPFAGGTLSPLTGVGVNSRPLAEGPQPACESPWRGRIFPERPRRCRGRAVAAPLVSERAPCVPGALANGSSSQCGKNDDATGPAAEGAVAQNGLTTLRGVPSLGETPQGVRGKIRPQRPGTTVVPDGTRAEGRIPGS